MNGVIRSRSHSSAASDGIRGFFPSLANHGFFSSIARCSTYRQAPVRVRGVGLLVVAVVLSLFRHRDTRKRAQGAQRTFGDTGLDCAGPAGVVPFRSLRSATSRLLDRDVKAR